jgi:3-oxoacyl-[acyl-carrier-protein] synthase-3
LLYKTKSVYIAGTGSYTPSRILTNEDIAARVPTNDQWIFENLGIRERRIAADDELTSDLAVEACRSALASANMSADDVDLLIVATSTPDRTAPSTACLVQAKLGMTNHSPAFDLAAVCTGFLYALTVGANMIASGTYKNALIVGADTFSRITDWSRRDCVFFGDGAGAVVLSHTIDPRALFSSALYADGRGHDAFTVPRGQQHFSMVGREVYETGTQVLPEAITYVLEGNGASLDDVRFLFPHQPSIRILQKTADVLGLPFERVMTNMDRYANTSGATIPLLLDEVHRQGRIAPGDLLAFAAVGSGWTWAAGLLRWL